MESSTHLACSKAILVFSPEANEQEGFWKMYEGIMMAYKNPTSHRRMKFTRERTIQIINFIDQLVGLLQNAVRNGKK